MKTINTKLIFAILVTVVGIILLVFKIVTFQEVLDNSIAIGTGLVAIYMWISKVEEEKKVRSLKLENTKLTAENTSLTGRRLKKVTKT